MDRQDIDALLIGALYGELTPAEEARLTAHLESHPTDRGALDDLKVTRQAFLDSRIFQVQLDPPQAVSALLLQEAHRRAPKAAPVKEEREGWFARFAKNFMAHPAMAAAAMLVLVLGGAGILWMKKGDAQLADQQYSQAPASKQERARSADTTVAFEGAPQGAANAGSGAITAGVADDGDRATLDEIADNKAADKDADGAAQSQSRYESQRAVAAAEEQKLKQERTRAATGRLEVNTDRAPMDLDSAKSDSDDLASSRKDTKAAKGTATATATASGAAAPRGGGGGGGGDLSFGGQTNAVSGAGAAAPGADATGGYAPPPPAKNAKAPAKTATTAGKTVSTEKKPVPPSAPAQPAPQTVAKPSTTPAANEPAKEAAPKTGAKDSALIAWAKQQHASAVAFANDGNCAKAAEIAVQVGKRAASYYAKEMASDRRLKGCQQRIAAEREADAERSQKARASKKTNADEPALESH